MKGFLMNFGALNKESTIFGFACSLDKLFTCSTDDDCKSEQRCSTLFGLLENGNQVCLPANVSSERLRKAGEFCLTNSMCVSNLCSNDGECLPLNSEA